MRSRTIALAAVLLAGGLGAASAQTNAPADGSPPAATTAPSGTGTPTISTSDPDIMNPRVNPSAAGTVMGGDQRPGGEALQKADEYGGTREVSPDTHPPASVEARKEVQKDRQDQPTGTARPQPEPTTDPAAGR